MNVFEFDETVVCINSLGKSVAENGIEIGDTCTVIKTFGVSCSDPWFIAQGMPRSMYTKDFEPLGTRYEDEEI